MAKYYDLKDFKDIDDLFSTMDRATANKMAGYTEPKKTVKKTTKKTTKKATTKKTTKKTVKRGK